MQEFRNIFKNKTFNEKKAKSYGLKKIEDKYVFEEMICDGDFKAYFFIKDDKISFKLIDMMNKEEYLNIYNEDFQGAYTSKIKDEFKNFLEKISSLAFDEKYFPNDQANRICDKIFENYKVKIEFPWTNEAYKDSGVFRHLENKKWFAAILKVSKNKLDDKFDQVEDFVLNLKIKPEDGQNLRDNKNIFEGYHMNHKHWISILLDEKISDDRIFDLLDKSFELTRK